MFLGIEQRESTMVGVVADDRGAIVARATREGSNGSAAAAAASLVGDLGGHGATCYGIALYDVNDGGDAILAAVAAAAGASSEAGSSSHASTVTLVSRGSAVALAEQWCGAARGSANVVALTAGDRVHAGIIINGVVFDGAHRRAGAASWLALNPVEREDYRKRGCLEAEAGASGIVRRFVWRVKAGDMSRAADGAGDFSTLTVHKILEAARAGDGVAISVVRDTTKYLGMTIGNMVTLLDPDIIVLGGFYAEAADLLIDQSRAEASRRVSPRVADDMRVVAGTLGDDAAAIGAARAAQIAP